MELKIYRSGNIIETVNIDENTVYSKQLMGEDKIEARFQSTSPMSLEIGDYIIHQDQIYEVNTTPEVTKLSSKLYDYHVTFEGMSYRLYNKIFMDEGEAEFDYFGDAMDFVQLVVDNMNSIDTGWTVGSVDATEPQLLSFSNTTCRQALVQIAQAFKLEYEIVGKQVNLVKLVGYSTNLSFSYGKGQGLYSLSRKYVQDLNLVTRVYGFGGSKNLDSSYRNGAKRLQFAAQYLEKNVQAFGIREGIYVNENIYPHRDGSVTGTDSNDHNSVVDANIDFDINNQLISGVVPQIVFKTGALAGYSFDITRYDASQKKISFKTFVDSNGYQLPNEINYPEIGDSYTIVGISMPQSYIDAAEAQLQEETQAYLDQNSIPRAAYELEIDRFYAKQQNILLKPGDRITIVDNDLGINQQIRIASISYPIIYPEAIQATIADTIPYTIQERILAKTLTNERVIKRIDRTSAEMARQNAIRYRQLQELVFDPDGYFDVGKIKPESIDTLMLSVGAKSQNFNLSGVTIIPNYQGNPSQLSLSSGELIHFEIEISGLGNVWQISQQTFTGLDAMKAYYVYAKCSQTQLSGTWMISTTPVKVDAIAGYFCFNLGVLYKVMNGRRDFAFTNGMTYIVGDQITAGRIKSLNGQTYFDLNTGEIQGVLKINAGSQGYQNLIDKPDLSPYDDVVDYVNNTLPGQLNNLQSQIDGSITTWFYAYAPTLTNAPANGWTDEATKNKHLGDLFYDTTTGYAYRFMVSNGVYAWQKITDSDVTLALQRASQAQDTADHKRRVFVSQPTPPYDVGDLWSQGASGDILVCTTSRASGSYNVADWTKASKYTDDTTALAAQAAATAAQNAANNAQASADAANAKLADMANDNKLTPGEKQDVLKEWQIIQAEKPNINAQAGTYSISTTNYDNAYNALSSYLSPLLSNMSVTSDIDGNTFRQKFSDYYTQKVLLTKAITDAAKTLADNAAAQAQNAQNTANNVASKTNFLTTTVDGNVVATGTLLVGDATGNNNAGITGVVDNGSSSIRFWAGDTYANKNSAPFRVLNDGTVYMNKGVLSGWLLDSTSLKTSATANNLPVMQIDSSGYIRMSTGTSGNAAYLKPTGLLMFAGSGEFITTYGFNTAGFFRINGDTNAIYKDMHVALFAEVVNNGWAAQFNGDVKMLKKLYINNGIIGNVNTSNSPQIYLSLSDFLVFPFYSSGTATIYLPYPEEDGQIIYVKPVNNNCTVSRHPSSSHQIIDNNGNLVNNITISRGDMWMFVYAGGYWMAGPMAL